MFRPRFLSAALLIVACVMLAVVLNRKAEEMVMGSARALDGDSLVVEGREMRLQGIDAPESRQICNLAGQSVPCGRHATQALQRWLMRGPVACTGHESDRYGRLLVTCRVHGTDINADLVRNGFVVDFGRYPAEEKEARAAFRGLWAGTFEPPAEQRRRLRAEAEARRANPPQP